MKNNSGADSDTRRIKGLNISDDVTWDSFKKVWHVKSQTDNKFSYEVAKKSSSCQKCDNNCGKCAHIMGCDCPDHANGKIVCKHIFKIFDLIERKGTAITFFFFPLLVLT